MASIQMKAVDIARFDLAGVFWIADPQAYYDQALFTKTGNICLIRIEGEGTVEDWRFKVIRRYVKPEQKVQVEVDPAMREQLEFYGYELADSPNGRK